MQLNDLLINAAINPQNVMVMRHRPWEPQLRKVLPWFAAENEEAFNAYQQTQGPKVDTALQKATYLASFIGHKPSEGVLVGIYRNDGWQHITQRQYWNKPVNKLLGGNGMAGPPKDQTRVPWFDLQLTEHYAEWKGKLVINWPGKELSWWRWASRNTFSIMVIHEESLFDEEMPPWEELVLEWKDLDQLPSRWKGALSQWRGIYLITDISDGKSYVGSAYGKDNIYGRWLNYAQTGHGGNKKLKRRHPRNFRFSILQRMSPDADPEAVIRLESSWKERLHTRTLGLNEN